MHKRPLKKHLKKRGLKKELGLFEITLYGIGIILGAGIYAIIGEGMIVHDGDDTADDETGTVIDAESSYLTSKEGLAVDLYDADDNLTIVYSKSPTELQDSDDESMYPRFLRKYIEYETLEMAFKANTDGYAPSLAEYWEMRKMAGMMAIEKYKNKRTYDRDFQLKTKGIPDRNVRRRPRLPDAYPDVW